MTLRRLLATALSMQLLASGPWTAAARAQGQDPPAAPAQEQAAPAAAQDEEAGVEESTAAAAEGFELSQAPRRIAERKVTLTLQSTPLTHILRAISRQTGASFIVAKELEDRRFSAFVNKVPLRDALRALLEAHSMGYEQVGNSNTYVVKELSRTRMRTLTRLFRLRYTQLAELTPSGGMASGSAFSIIGLGGGAGPGSNTSGSAPAAGGRGGNPNQPGAGLLAAVGSVLSDRGRLQIDAQTNTLIVTDAPENFPAIEEVIENVDQPVPQVLIEVDVVETSLGTGKRLGLEFGGATGALASFTGPARLVQFPSKNNNQFFTDSKELQGASITGTPVVGDNPNTGVFYGMLSFQEFSAVLRALETSGEGKFLAKPKILTLNNKAAEISITADTAVGVQSASLIAQSGLLTTTAERRQTGIQLKVTPQVNDGGLVTLLLEPTISRPQASQFFPTQFVDSQTRSVRTSVRVKDGATLLIGGLLSDDVERTVRKVPFFGSIPIIGWLFTSVNNTASKTELMIFITPRVAKGV